MKKTQLIEWGIITIGIVFGYKFFESIFSILVYLFYQLEYSYSEVTRTLVSSVIFTVIYGLSFIVLIKKSRPIARYLGGPETNENVSLKLGKRSVLHVVLIAICLASVLSKLPTLLIYLFETFKNEAGGRDLPVREYDSVTKFAFKTAAVQTVVALAVLYFSKSISSWFIVKDEVEELTFESEIKE